MHCWAETCFFGRGIYTKNYNLSSFPLIDLNDLNILQNINCFYKTNEKLTKNVLKINYIQNT